MIVRNAIQKLIVREEGSGRDSDSEDKSHLRIGGDLLSPDLPGVLAPNCILVFVCKIILVIIKCAKLHCHFNSSVYN